MMDRYSIKVNNLSKIFYPRIKNNKLSAKKTYGRIKKPVLNNISFTVLPGEVVGIIGGNGSGKSTLLSILAGIYYPTTGSVEVSGKIVSILELGLGFDFELSGRENIIQKGLSNGLSKKEIHDKIDDILQFAELTDCSELPIKTYSSGMLARLAFSILINLNGDILLIDEILSVGDVLFTTKCNDFFNKSIKHGKTIIIVSHSIQDIQRICTRTIWLEKGEIIADGPTNNVCAKYIYEKTESIQAITSLAKAHVSSAQYKLAKLYQSGEIINKDISKYKELISASSKSGYPEALYEMAVILLNEKTIDKQEIWNYLYSAAKCGHSQAKIKIAQIFTNENDSCTTKVDDYASTQPWNLYLKHNYAMMLLDVDPSSGIKFLKDNCKKNFSLSQRELGICYLYGKNIYRDIQKAIFYLNRAAKQYDIPSINKLYSMYSTGEGVEINDEKAFEYCILGASVGDGQLQFEAFQRLTEGKGTKKSKEDAEKWLMRYKISCSAGQMLNVIQSMCDAQSNSTIKLNLLNKLCNAFCIEAYYQKGHLYGTQSDVHNALTNLEYAAQYGHTLAMREAYSIIFTNEITDKYPLALKYCQFLSKYGDVYALTKMALYYRDKSNLKAHLSVSIFYLELAAKTKDPWPTMELYNTYFLRNQKGDLEKAFQVALDNSYKDEYKIRIGISYRDGIGVSPDMDNAINYLESIQDKGNSWAIKELYYAYLKRNSVEDIKRANNLKNGGRIITVVDIWGCCVSRDTIAMGGASNEILVRNYIQDCSFPLQFTDPVINKNIESNDYCTFNIPNFYKKMYCYDWNKNVIETLSQSDASWLITDMWVMNYYIIKIIEKGKTIYLTNTRLNEKLHPNSLNIDEGTQICSIEPLDEVEMNANWEKFIKFCKKRYGNKIILICVRESKQYLDKARCLKQFDSNDQWTQNCIKWEQRFIKEINPHIIPCPPEIISDELHKWGLSKVHYTQEYYEYATKQIQHIINPKFKDDSNIKPPEF